MQIGLFPNPKVESQVEQQRLDAFADLLRNETGIDDVKRTYHTGYDRGVGEPLSEWLLVTNAILTQLVVKSVAEISPVDYIVCAHKAIDQDEVAALLPRLWKLERDRN
jgi:hypothetical protein